MLDNASSNQLYALGEIFHNLGTHMLEDDAEDIGYYTYYGRTSHIYHGVRSPDHPSPLHHWQFAFVPILLGKMMALASVAKSIEEEDQPIIQPGLPQTPQVFAKINPNQLPPKLPPVKSETKIQLITEKDFNL